MAADCRTDFEASLLSFVNILACLRKLTPESCKSCRFCCAVVFSSIGSSVYWAEFSSPDSLSTGDLSIYAGDGFTFFEAISYVVSSLSFAVKSARNSFAHCKYSGGTLIP